MTLPLHEYLVSLVLVLSLAFLAIRLLISRLAGTYRLFFCFVLLDTVQALAPFILSFRSSAYFYFFVATESLTLCFYALIVFELYRVLFQNLKGIAGLAQRYTLGALATAVLLAILLRVVLPKPHRPLEQFFYFEISVVSSLVLFILLLMAFLVYYPIPIHRNALVYAAGYAAYFLAKATVLFVNNLGSSSWLRTCSTIASLVALVSVVFWAMCLSREGEKRTIVAGHRWSTPGTQEQVLQRLYELNKSLLRARAR